MPESKYSSYKPLTVDLRPERLESFREARCKNGSSMSAEIKQFIAEYLHAQND